jgi:fumarate reductase subunit D
VVGIPLTVATAQQLGRFSLFALAPISCLILLVLLVWPNLWQKLTDVQEENEKITPAMQPQ